MFDSLHRVYKKRKLREKFLLQGFIVILILIWMQSIFSKTSTWNDQRKTASIELLTQQQWLDRKLNTPKP